MPTFLWRSDPVGYQCGAPLTQLQVLRAWANIVIEMYTRDTSISTWPLTQVLDFLQDEKLPSDAVQLLSTCLDEV